jgi:hypothetical protein
LGQFVPEAAESITLAQKILKIFFDILYVETTMRKAASNSGIGIWQVIQF